MNNYYDFFFNLETEKKTVLDQQEVSFLFQLLKLRKFRRKNCETNWWKLRMNSLIFFLLTFGIAFSSSLRACLGAIRSSVLTDILLNSSSHWARISWAFWIRASVVSRQAGLKFCKWAEMASAANFASPQIPMSISVIINWTI